MLVKTPALKLEVKLETVRPDGDDLMFEGFAGMMTCETRISAAEVWSLLRMCLRPQVIGFLLKSIFKRSKRDEA